MIPCVNCNTENPDKAKFCVSCGNRIGLKCPTCGEPVEAHYKFCFSCGSPISLELSSSLTDHPLKSRDELIRDEGETYTSERPAQKKMGEASRLAHPSTDSILTPALSLSGRGNKSKASPVLSESATEPPSLEADELPAFTTESEQTCRRTVTVMFADLSGFTTWSEKMDPESVRTNLNQAFSKIGTIIKKYGGEIDKYLGDGVLALFGYPKAYEDNNLRACLASIEIRESLENFFLQISETTLIDAGTDKKPVRIKIALHTGTVVIGQVGSENVKQEKTIIGDTVNVASRIEDHCQPGQILASESTCRNLKEKFRMKDFGPVSLRGREEKVKVIEILSLREEKEVAEEFSAQRSIAQLVGRETEMQILEKSYRRTLAGKGEIVAILGDAGLGKTRLVYEFYQKFILGSDFIVMKGKGQSFGLSEPYAFISTILKYYFRIGDVKSSEERTAKITEKLNELSLPAAEIMEGLDPLWQMAIEAADPNRTVTIRIPPEEKRRLLFNTVIRIIQAQSKLKPVCVIAGDMHWMEPLSQEFIEKLAHEIADFPVLLVAVARPSETTTKILRSCYQLPHFTQITLKELDAEQTVQIAESILRSSSIPQQARKIIEEKSEGNPFYVEELVYSMIELKVMEMDFSSDVPAQSRWRFNEKLALKVPDTIQGIVLSRLDHLSPEAKRAARFAATIGKNFTDSVLSELWKLTQGTLRRQDDLSKALKELENAKIVFLLRVAPEKEYTFKHALAQETIYESISMEDRKNIHGQVAQTIEKLYPNQIYEFFEILAHHYEHSAEPRKAIHYLHESAAKAFARYANTTKKLFIEKMVSLAHKTGDYENECKGYLRLAQSALYEGKVDKAQNYIKTGLSLAKDYRLIYLEGELLFALGRVYRRLGQMEKALESYQECYRKSEKSANLKLQVKVFHRIGNLYQEQGQADIAMNYYNRALPIAQKLNSIQFEASLETAMAQIYEKQGERKKALSLLLKSLDAHKLLDDKLGQAYDHDNLGTLYFNEGNAAKAIEHLEKSLSINEQVGYHAGVCWDCLHLGNVYLRLGDFQKALSFEQRALSMSQETGYRIAECNALSFLGSIYRRLGQFNQMMDSHQRALAIAREINDNRTIIKELCHVGSCQKDQGDVVKAVDSFQEALKMAEESEDLKMQEYAHGSLGFIYYHIYGNYYSGLIHLEKAMELSQTLKTEVGEIYSRISLCRFWCDIGDLSKAVQHLSKVQEINRKIKFKDLTPWITGLMARVETLKGNMQEGERFSRQSLAEAESMGYRRYYLQSCLDIAFCCERLNKISEAKDFSLRAVQLVKESGELTELPRALQSFARVLQKIGELTQAEDCLMEALELSRKMNGRRYLQWICSMLSEIARVKGDKEKEKDLLLESLRVHSEMISEMTEDLRKLYLTSKSRNWIAERVKAFFEEMKTEIPGDVLAQLAIFNFNVPTKTEPVSNDLALMGKKFPANLAT